MTTGLLDKKQHMLETAKMQPTFFSPGTINTGGQNIHTANQLVPYWVQ